MITQGQASFQARIARINSGKVSCMPQPGVSDGTGSCWVSPRAAGQMRRKTRSAAAHPLAPFWALFLGLLAFVLSQLAGFHLLDLPDPEMTADMHLVLDAVGAMAVLTALSMLFSAPSGTLVIRLAGIALAMCTMHNLVHMQPELFAQVFSARWVEDVRSATAPGSILFRGVSYPLL
ncbi:hypothetical protein [Marinovum sp.]|uniref:hypothetical protein n=1 Tax=Marinovum sp. TaxID=2024839 RepID=UPI002B26C825|nr:hypothetical protein [Marinovum sp.]